LSETPRAAAAPVRRGANVYLAASGVAQVSALLRYVVLARMLGPEQLGLAATLVLTAAFFDMISDTGSDRFLIQDRHGDTPDAQKLVHLVYISRGAAIALGLALLAWPISVAYKAPQLAGGLAMLGVTQMVLGFMHLDQRRAQRHLDFRSEAVCLIASEVSSLLATALAAYLTHNFTAILYGLITRSLVVVLVSHLRAQRPYRVGYSPEHAGRLSKFAGPLMLNGALLFFATQGDRALVGSQLGFVALGRYSAIILLIIYPVASLTRYTQAMYLPVLARARDDPTERMRIANVMGGQILMLALLISAGFAIVAPIAVKFLYGKRFSEAALTVALIGVLQTSRFLQVYPTVVALSVGRSSGPLAVNATRLAAYPAALVGGLALGGLPGIVAGFVTGELLAQGVGLILMNRNFDRPTFAGFGRIVTFGLASCLVLGWTWTVEHGALPIAAVLFVASGGLTIWIWRREAAAVRASIDLVRRLTRGASMKLVGA
jgi:O-antigen/teichoic acid export membrane protein